MRFAPPTPELPVPDVAQAQAYYHETLGFEIAWYNAEGEIGAVARGPCAIFFRKADAAIAPATFWVFADDVDAAHAELKARGADIFDPLSNKPWGLRQFTVRDCFGNLFNFHHDL